MTNKQSTNRSASADKPKTKPSVVGTSKLDLLLTLLRKPTGATIDELAAATNWQKHSVRGAIAGTLKKKGHSTTSEVVDGVRRYRIAETHA